MSSRNTTQVPQGRSPEYGNVVDDQLKNWKSATSECFTDLDEQLRGLVEELRFNYHGTSLVRLKKIPQYYGIQCEVWVKCEFENLSGSSKDREVYIMLLHLERCGKLRPGQTTLITHTSSSFSLALAVVNARLGKHYPLIAILPDDVSGSKCTILQGMGVNIIRAPSEALYSIGAEESPGSMAEFLWKKIADSYVLDPYSHPLSAATHFFWTGPEVLNQLYPYEIQMVVCPICGTGAIISGLFPLFKSTFENCAIVGTDLNGELTNLSAVQKGSTDLTEGINSSTADYWCKVTETDAFLRARELIRIEGIPASTPAGAVLHAALVAAENLGFSKNRNKKLLLILDDSLWNSDLEYGSNQWLVTHGHVTDDYIESSLWFHKIHAWRLPLDELVVIPTNLTTTAAFAILKERGLSRAVVVDAQTRSPAGVTTITMLQSLPEDAPNTPDTFIGESNTMCTSIKSFHMNDSISTLLEGLKTRLYAVLVHQQRIISSSGITVQEWVTGLVSISDIIRFLVDVETKHAAKFGANLSGGFQSSEKLSCKEYFRIDPTQLSSSSELRLGNKNKFDPSSFAAAVAPRFAEQIVMKTSVGPGPVPARLRRENRGSLVVERTSSEELLASTLDLASPVTVELEDIAPPLGSRLSSSCDSVHAPASASRILQASSDHASRQEDSGSLAEDFISFSTLPRMGLAGSSQTQALPAAGSSANEPLPPSSKPLHPRNLGCPQFHSLDDNILESPSSHNILKTVPRTLRETLPNSATPTSTNLENAQGYITVTSPPVTAIMKFATDSPPSESPGSSVSSVSFSPTSEPFSPCLRGSCSGSTATSSTQCDDDIENDGHVNVLGGSERQVTLQVSSVGPSFRLRSSVVSDPVALSSDLGVPRPSTNSFNSP